MMAIAIGTQMPAFKLKNVDGKTLAADDVSRGKQASVIIFSCNHCPYVQAWEDRIIEIGKTFGPRGVGYALINSNDPTKYPEDGYPKMVQRSKSKGYPFPYLHDEDQSVARAYGATRTPEVFLFDANRKLRYHGRIDDNYEHPQQVKSHDLKNALESVLSGKVPADPDTPVAGCTIKWK